MFTTLPTKMDVSIASSPRGSFDSLPPELHDKIWLMTFEPRIISIYIHEGKTSDDPTHPSAAIPLTRPRLLKPACQVFTAALVMEPPSVHIASIYKRNGQIQPWWPDLTLPIKMKTKPPPGPVGLYFLSPEPTVCPQKLRTWIRRSQSDT